MTVLFTELNCIIFTALYRTLSTSHGIEFMVNDRKIFYGLIPLSSTVCNRINYVFFKSVYIAHASVDFSVASWIIKEMLYYIFLTRLCFHYCPIHSYSYQNIYGSGPNFLSNTPNLWLF